MGGHLSTAAFVVLATACFTTGRSQGSCPPRIATVRADQAQVVALEQKLAQREGELAKVRSQLRSIQDDQRWYDEAKVIGVVDAVSHASSLTPRQQKRLAIAIVREAHANKLDPLLVVAVIRSESSFNNFAVSGVGAMGLMQMMPDTGSWLAKKRGSEWHSKDYLFDSELNVELGCAYLANLIHNFGRVDKALVAYNAGPGLAKKILANRASRTKFMAGYPHKVIGEWRKLQAQKDRLLEAMAEPVPMAVQTALK